MGSLLLSDAELINNKVKDVQQEVKSIADQEMSVQNYIKTTREQETLVLYSKLDLLMSNVNVIRNEMFSMSAIMKTNLSNCDVLQESLKSFITQAVPDKMVDREKMWDTGTASSIF